jgi:hypothetical protein
MDRADRDGEWIKLDDLRAALTRKAARDVPAADERQAFEAWARRVGYEVDTFKAEGEWTYSATFANVAWEAWQARASIAHPIGQVSPAIDQPECGICNDSGIVGFPPDQYEDCPDCAKARAAAGESPAPVCHAPADEEISGAEMHDVVHQLREYASNPGYSHNDYADTMRQAANCIELLRARFWNYAGLSQFANGEDAAPEAAHAQKDAVPAEPFVVLTKAECDIALRWLDVTRLYAFVESEDDELAEKLNLPAAISPSDEKGKADYASAGGLLTIDSAPKDGTEVIGFDGRRHFQMRWVAYRGSAEPCWHDLSANRWATPTHWMPLPTIIATDSMPATSAADAKDALRATIEALPIVHHLSGDEVLYRADVLAAMAASRTGGSGGQHA